MAPTLTEKVRDIATYLGNSHSPFYTAYEGEDLRLSFDELTSASKVFVGSELVFSQHRIPIEDPHFTPGQWEGKIDGLYKKAMEIKTQKLKAVEIALGLK